MNEHPIQRQNTENATFEINFVFARHAEKQSGNTYSDDGNISESLISESGRQEARAFGSVLKGLGVDPKIAYPTNIERTRETLKEVLASDDPVGNKRQEYFSFPVEFAPEIEKEFKRISDLETSRIMTLHFSGRELKSLSPQEQENVAWQATEPALAWILDLDATWPNSDTNSTPYKQASEVAYKMLRLIDLPATMQNVPRLKELGKRIDLLSVGHKTQTEIFLAYVLRGIEGETLSERLHNLGGGLHVMEGWRLNVKRNNSGSTDVCVFFRGKEYEVDLVKIAELANAYENDVRNR